VLTFRKGCSNCLASLEGLYNELWKLLGGDEKTLPIKVLVHEWEGDLYQTKWDDSNPSHLRILKRVYIPEDYSQLDV